MTQTVDQIARAIVGREGGYVNDPDDPGGPTKYGVTIHTMRVLRVDIDGDGDVDVRDVKLLTIDKAVDIFKRHYYRKPNIHMLPEDLQASVFDMQVNAGGNAGKILQRVLNEFGESLAVDGAIGPATAAAAKRVQAKANGYLVDAYGIARREYYMRLADRRSTLRKYARRRDGGKGGWIVRAEEFISPRYDWSDAEFRERTAAWA